MLKPALLYADEITRKFAEHLYTTDYYYYCGYYCGSTLPKIEEKDDLYQYAFVDAEDNVIGFLTYRIKAVLMAISAIRLQYIEKEPLFGDDNGVDVYTCPECWCSIPHKYQSHCDHCGQRLDWWRYRT